jgi:hypothetical protein
VLEKEKNVADAALLPRIDQILLQAEGGSVIEQAELKSGNQWVTPVWILRLKTHVCQKRADIGHPRVFSRASGTCSGATPSQR